jgi:L-threonylcarbamoyladenylate synthase
VTLSGDSRRECDDGAVPLSYDTSDPEQRSVGIIAAVDAVRRGAVVVLPADASYGVAVDAFQPSAVSQLAVVKERGRDMPVPVLVGSWRGLDGLMLVTPRIARDLIQAFWPGPLTLLVEHAPSLLWDLGDARGTVAVRMPLHPVTLEVLAEIGPMAVSGANKPGRAPAMDVAEAREQFGTDVAVYLDAGPLPEQQPSTVLDMRGDVPRLLRPGAVTVEEIRAVVGEVIVPEPEVAAPPPPPEPPLSSVPPPAEPPLAAASPDPA